MSNSFVFINDNNELHKLNMNVTSNQNDLTFDNNLIINGNVDFSGDLTKNGNPLISSLKEENTELKTKLDELTNKIKNATTFEDLKNSL